MIRLDIYPRIGIGPIQFGATREQVRKSLLENSIPFERERRLKDFFLESSIQVEYDKDGTASFIGISSRPSLSLFFNNVDLFDSEASTVFNLFAEHDNSGSHIFTSHEYSFPGNILTLYEADEQYDYRRNKLRPVWAEIGAGDSRYLNAILKIHDGQLNPYSK